MSEKHVVRAGRSVRFRTFWLVAIPLVLPMIYTVLVVPELHRRSLLDESRQRAESLVTVLAANAAPQLEFVMADEADNTNLVRGQETAAQDRDVVYLKIVGRDGKALAGYGEGAKRLDLREDRFVILDKMDANQVMHVAGPIRKGENVLGYMQLGVSLARVVDESSSFRLWALLLAALVLLVAGGIAFYLGQDFARLFDQLRSSILTTAQDVDEVVSRLAAVTAQQTSAAAEESSALMETNASASALGQAAGSTSQRASLLIAGGKRAEEDAGAGLEAVGTATQAMREVREQMSTIAATIGAFSERAAAIGDINATVALLAERSNLLALNAAIEAARAGSQGRGFSVVANEMRALADGSNRSAGQVKAIIGEIQSAIARAVSDVREGERRVQNTEQLSVKAGESIRRFADSTREFATLGKEIASAANEQSTAIEQMIESIAHATEAGSTQLETTKQVEETARQLRRMSHQLLQALSTRTAKPEEALGMRELPPSASAQEESRAMKH